MRDDVRPAFGAYAADEATFEALRAAAGLAGLPVAAVGRGDLEIAIETIAGLQHSPGLLVVDIADHAAPAEGLTRLADACDPDTRVLVLGGANDVKLYRRIVELGVEDYLPKPLDAGELAAALQAPARSARPAAAAAQPETAQRRRIVLVIGARGGVGAGTIACSLASDFAGAEEDVALVDLDLQYGSAAFRLDAEAGPGLADALASPERIDDLFLERAATRIGERLFLLAAEQNLTLPPPDLHDAIEPFFARLRERFPLSVIDLPRHLVPGLALPLLDSDAVVVVLDQSLVGLRDGARLLRHLKAAAPFARRLVVLNQIGTGGAPEVTPAEIAQALDTAIDVTVPFDPRAVGDAMRIGRPVGGKKSRAGGALADLAAKIADRAPPRRARFGFLARRSRP